MPFNTPQNQRSFSALIDDVIVQTGHPQLIRSIVGFANSTIRECQARGFFHKDLTEDKLAAVPNSPYIWTPSVADPTGAAAAPYFRWLKAAKYTTQNVWPKLKQPGKRQGDQDLDDWYYYGADDYYVFNGPLIGEDIAIAYYSWAAPLMYFQLLGDSTSIPGGPYTTRPAYFDILTGQWMYLITSATPNVYATTTGNPTTDAAAQAQSSNWLVQDWYDTIVEGTKAKVFASKGDTRNQQAYALYTSLREGLRNSVGREGNDND